MGAGISQHLFGKRITTAAGAPAAFRRTGGPKAWGDRASAVFFLPLRGGGMGPCLIFGGRQGGLPREQGRPPRGRPCHTNEPFALSRHPKRRDVKTYFPANPGSAAKPSAGAEPGSPCAKKAVRSFTPSRRWWGGGGGAPRAEVCRGVLFGTSDS